jgi:hypothetical protein
LDTTPPAWIKKSTRRVSPDTDSNKPGEDSKVQDRRNAGNGNGMMDKESKIRYSTAFCTAACLDCKEGTRQLLKMSRISSGFMLCYGTA